MTPIHIAFCLDKKIGDSLVGMLFANQLAQAGFQITLCSTVLKSLTDWLPFQYQSAQRSPETIEDIFSLSQEYDVVIIYHYPDLAEKMNDASCLYSKLHNVVYFTPWGFSGRLPKANFEQFHNTTLNLMAQFAGQCFVNKKLRPFQYIESLCKKLLIPLNNLIVNAKPSISNTLQYQRYPKRVLIHPTASIHKHCWSPYKFIKLAKHLKSTGFQPVFILHASELQIWKTYLQDEFEYINLPLNLLADYIYESGYAICNASGIGHLCSFLKIPTVTINVNRSWEYKKWAPFFWKNEIVSHSKWQPNSLPSCKTHRHTLISSKTVYQTFLNTL